MSSESKWRETTVSGDKGPSVYSRNLGTSTSCSDGLLSREDPRGSARCRDEYSGRRAGSPGTAHVCQGKRGTACGARGGEGHLSAATTHWVGGDEALLCPARDRRCGTGCHAGRWRASPAGAAAAGAGLLFDLRQVQSGPDVLPRTRRTGDLPAGRAGQPARAVLLVLPAGVDDRVRGRTPLQGKCGLLCAAL